MSARKRLTVQEVLEYAERVWPLGWSSTSDPCQTGAYVQAQLLGITLEVHPYAYGVSVRVHAGKNTGSAMTYHESMAKGMLVLHGEFSALLVNLVPGTLTVIPNMLIGYEAKKDVPAPPPAVDVAYNATERSATELERRRLLASMWPVKWWENTTSIPSTYHALVRGIEVSVLFTTPFPTGYVQHRGAIAITGMSLNKMLCCMRKEVDSLSKRELPPVKDEREELLDSAWTHLKAALPESEWAFDDGARKAVRRRTPDQGVGMILFVRYLDANLLLYLTMASDEGRVGGKQAGTTWYVRLTGNRAVGCMSEAIDSVFGQMAGLREREVL